MHCLAGSLLWQEILGELFVCPKKCWCKKIWTIFLKKYCFSPCPKRIRPLIKPLLKNSFSTNFQGTGPWEGPIHFSRFVQFTLVGLFSGFTIAANFSRADPGAKRRKKSLVQKQPVLSLSLSLSLFLCLSFSLSLILSLSLHLPLSLPLSLPLPLLLPLPLSLSCAFSRSLSLCFLFLFLFLIAWFIKKKIRWKR